MNVNPIGIFDSGIGGLSVVAEFRSKFPSEDIVYFADTKNYPYGTKDASQVCCYVANVIEFLKEQKAKAVLCACSTASAVAIPKYQNENLPVIGMFNKFLIDDVIEYSLSKDIALIATELTVKSKAFEDFFYSYESDHNIIGQAANSLVNAVTSGDLSYEVLNPIIEQILKSFKDYHLGGLIIGCTHFYHIKSFLKEILPDLPIIEPAKSAVRKIADIVDYQQLQNLDTHKGTTYCFVSGEIDDFKRQVRNVESFHGFSFIDEYKCINELSMCS